MRFRYVLYSQSNQMEAVEGLPSASSLREKCLCIAHFEFSRYTIIFISNSNHFCITAGQRSPPILSRYHDLCYDHPVHQKLYQVPPSPF